MFVPELTEEDLADIHFAREAIETAALRRIMAAGEAVSVARRLTIEPTGWSRHCGKTTPVVDHPALPHPAGGLRAQLPLSRMYSARMCLHMLVSGFAGRKDFVDPPDPPDPSAQPRSGSEPLKSLSAPRPG